MRLGRRLAALGVVAVAILATAAPASAHAELVTSDPAAQATLPAGQPPTIVTLTFTEGVQVPDDAIRVLDAGTGTEVDGVGDSESGDDDRVVTATLPALEDGDYVVDWRVVSQDSHPIRESYTFTVGESDTDANTISELLDSGRDNRGIGITFGLARALAFASVLVLVGVIVFIRTRVPDVGADPTVRTILWVSWVVAVVTAVAGIGLQAAYSTGRDIAAAWDRDALGGVLDTQFGQWWLARAGLVVLALAALRAPERPRSPVANAVDAVIGVGILATFTFAGHARTGRWTEVAYVTDVVHLAAAAVWFGGVVTLVALLARRSPSTLGPDAAVRFSRVAAPAIAVVAVSGTVQGWRQTGQLEALFDTTYGRLLLTKIVIVVLIVAAASVSRHVVRSWQTRALVPAGGGPSAAASEPHTDHDETHDLRSAVVVEVALAGLVLLFTAVLVNTTPARVAADGDEATASATAFETTLDDAEADLRVAVALASSAPGSNTLTVDVTRDDTGLDVPEITATLTPQTGDIAPIEVELTPAGTGPGSYTATTSIPFAGEWDLEIRVTYTSIDQSVLATTVTIG
ncbi:MAG: copper resistance CopC/CopD family protein [Actinomycetota bacterium]